MYNDAHLQIGFIPLPPVMGIERGVTTAYGKPKSGFTPLSPIDLSGMARGFIICEGPDKPRIFLHATDFTGAFNKIAVGQLLYGEVIETNKGWRAKNVSLAPLYRWLLGYYNSFNICRDGRLWQTVHVDITTPPDPCLPDALSDMVSDSIMAYKRVISHLPQPSCGAYHFMLSLDHREWLRYPLGQLRRQTEEMLGRKYPNRPRRWYKREAWRLYHAIAADAKMIIGWNNPHFIWGLLGCTTNH